MQVCRRANRSNKICCVCKMAKILLKLIKMSENLPSVSSLLNFFWPQYAKRAFVAYVGREGPD